MSNYIILLPPSEGKVKCNNNKKFNHVKDNHSFSQLNNFRQEIFNKLNEIIDDSNEIDLQKLFDMKNKKLQEVLEYTYDMFNKETLHSIERYSGVMFNAIDYNSLDDIQKKNFDNNVIFISGLFGLLKPKDLIPNYKLKINSKLNDLNLTNFWKEKLRGIFNDLFKDKLVVDILPEAHRKIIELNNFDNIISIKFCEIKNDKFKNVGHESKLLKGDLIRYLVSFNDLNRNDLMMFEHGKGYKYSSELSSNKEIIYLKDV